MDVDGVLDDGRGVGEGLGEQGTGKPRAVDATRRGELQKGDEHGRVQ